MPRFLSRSPQATLAGLMLLAGSAAAQAPRPAPGVVPPPPLPPTIMAPPPASLGAIDLRVTALFNQAIAAHQALPALSAVVAVSLVGAGPQADKSQTVALTYQKPDRAKVEISNSAGPVVQFLSDGKTLTLYLIPQKQYQVQPVPAGAQVIPLIMDQPRALLLRLLGHPEALSDLPSQPGLTASVVSPSFAFPADVGGVPVDTVAAALPAPDGSTAKFTFDFGKTDHLLRRIVENTNLVSGGKPQSVTLTQTITALSTTPTLTAANFRFTPPPGVTKIVTPPPKASQAEPPMHDPRPAQGR